MTSAPMIAVMVIIVACLVGIVIACIFCIFDRFCHRCKYKNKCDYYKNKNNPQ